MSLSARRFPSSSAGPLKLRHLNLYQTAYPGFIELIRKDFIWLFPFSSVSYIDRRTSTGWRGICWKKMKSWLPAASRVIWMHSKSSCANIKAMPLLWLFVLWEMRTVPTMWCRSVLSAFGEIWTSLTNSENLPPECIALSAIFVLIGCDSASGMRFRFHALNLVRNCWQGLPQQILNKNSIKKSWGNWSTCWPKGWRPNSGWCSYCGICKEWVSKRWAKR